MLSNGFTQIPAWIEVDEAMAQSRPRTAEKLTMEILKNAKKTGNCQQIIKSYVYLLHINDSYKENPIEKSLKFLEKEKLNSPECETFRNALLGYLYYTYYIRHKYQILDRTEKNLTPGEDIATWTVQNFAQTADKYFTKALQNITTLKKYPAKDFPDLFTQGTAPITLRPTVFDLAAWWIIKFYQDYDFSLTHPRDMFVIDKPDYFLPAKDFVKINISTTDTLSHQYKTLKIYQLISREHLNDGQIEALVDADLKRIDYVYSLYQADDNQKDSLYINALKKIIETYPRASRTSMAYYMIANYFYENADEKDSLTKDFLKQAVFYAQKAMQYPENDITKEAIGLATYLRNKIKEKHIAIEEENPIAPDNNFPIRIKFRNIDKIYLRLYKINDDLYYSDESFDKITAEIFSSQLMREQTFPIPDPGDYYEHSTEIILNALPAGKYAIVISLNPDFKKDNNILAISRLNATDINITTEKTDRKLLIIATDRINGKPLHTLPITLKYEVNFRQTKSVKLRTDKNGMAEFDLPSHWTNITISAHHNQSDLTIKTSASRSLSGTYSSTTHTVIFLDRKIYRPGQTVYFKGLMYSSDGRDNIKAMANQTISLKLQDPNYQTIDIIGFRTDSFGGFSGTFVIPKGRSTGLWHISSDDYNNYANVSFRVEEYRRPQFEVKMDTIKETILAGKEVSITGQAINYNGIPVENANVEYQVIKRVGWYWLWWWGEKPEETVMTTGKTTTDKNGKFVIIFPTDKDVKQNQLVEYIIKAKVTDINGETHNAQTSVRVANQSVFLKLNAKEKLFLSQSPDFSIRIENINGIEQKQLQCNYQIYSLKPPQTHPLIERLWQKPDIYSYTEDQWKKLLPYYAYGNEANPKNWTTDKIIKQGTITSGKTVKLSISKQGIYKLIAAVKDPLTGKDIKTEKVIYLLDEKDKTSMAPITLYLAPLKEKYQPGETARILVGSGWTKAQVFYQITWEDNILEQGFLTLDKEQKIISFPVSEKMRGGVAVNFLLIHNNRAINEQVKIDVPFASKKLNLQILNFKDKVTPGENISWKIRITDSKGNPVIANLTASAYDASLDAFVNNKWDFHLSRYSNSFYSMDLLTVNKTISARITDLFNRTRYFRPFTYPEFNWYKFNFYGIQDHVFYAYGHHPKYLRAISKESAKEQADITEATPLNAEVPEQAVNIPVRKDFRETAFFYPDIVTDSNGIATISFKLPESLTRWHLQMLANTSEMNYALIHKEFKAAKPLMVYPNVPRFFRQGDTLSIVTKVYNNTEKDLTTTVKLTLKNASTGELLDIILSGQSQQTEIKAGSDLKIEWKIAIPDTLTDPIEYTITAISGEYSDGQQDIVPVLSNRMLVTETLPLPVGPKEKKTFHLTKLAENKSSTLQNYRFVLEFNSNPLWYALTSLPYTMEYPYECNEQLFSRVFANSVASFILNSDPRIKRVFDIWKMHNSQALTSELEKKQNLKQIVLEETPWLLDGKNDTENRARMAILFDLNQMAYQQSKDIEKLLMRQNRDGGWPWFPGMESSWFVTQHIALGFARMKEKGVLDYTQNIRLNSALHSAVKFSDTKVEEYYQDLKKYYKKLEGNHLIPIIVHYLYMRSFYQNIPVKDQKVFDYFFGQLQKYWTSLDIYDQATAALALYQWGDKKTAKQILTSLRERALENKEMGVYWAENKPGWFWYQAPIETQAMIIDAFNHIDHDTAFVEKMKIWLLKNKQTNRWESTKATVEAVYALIFTGYNWLGENKPVKITVGNTTYPRPGQKTEAGTGYFQQIWTNKEITSDLATIKVDNPNNHPAWGAVYWQYFENMDKITPAEAGVKVQRTYYKVIKTDRGEQLQAITENSPIHVGDEIVVRLILTTDRDMEFIHLKDMRPAGFEPLDQLSGYQWKAGIGYYQSIRDASANFFIDNLRKGKYVFEYRVYATVAGKLSAGIATFQSMYAPEFSAHSSGIKITVK